MKLIVGLGNPGKKYSKTRHNIGRRLVEALAGERGVVLKPDFAFNASLAVTSESGTPLILACPETFMNRSGEAVSALVRYYKIDPGKNLLVVVDDIALVFGQLRLRAQGSEGGHNGLKSIAERLASKAYARLRMGIADQPSPEPEHFFSVRLPLEDYVLQNFNPSEERRLKDVLEKGLQACRLWMGKPIQQAMNIVNACA